MTKLVVALSILFIGFCEQAHANGHYKRHVTVSDIDSGTTYCVMVWFSLAIGPVVQSSSRKSVTLTSLMRPSC